MCMACGCTDGEDSGAAWLGPPVRARARALAPRASARPANPGPDPTCNRPPARPPPARCPAARTLDMRRRKIWRSDRIWLF